MNVTAQVKLEESMILAFIDPFLVLILLEITLGLRDQGKFDKQDLNRKGSHAGLFCKFAKIQVNHITITHEITTQYQNFRSTK